MKTIKKLLIVWAVTLMIVYLVSAFITAQINFVLWSALERATYVFFSFVWLIIVSVIYAIYIAAKGAGEVE